MTDNVRPTLSVTQPVTPRPAVICVLDVASVTSTTASLTWEVPNMNGTTFQNYVIQRRTLPAGLFEDVGTSPTADFVDTGLSPNTLYEYRVYTSSVEGASAAGLEIEAETYPSIPLLDEPYAFFAVANIADVFLTAIDAAVEVTQTSAGGATNTINLVAGTAQTVSGAQFDSFVGDGAFIAVGRILNHWFVLNPNYTAGKRFAYGPTRNNPQSCNVYALEDANVTVTFDGTVVGSGFVGANTGQSFGFTGTNATVQVESDGFILASQTSNNSVDQTVLMPASQELVGFPSNSARVYPVNAGTAWGAGRANGEPYGGGYHETNTKSGNIDSTGTQYGGDAVIVRATDLIVAASFADGDGSKAAPFLPTNLMCTRFAVPFVVERVNFASSGPFTITTSNGNNYSSSGSSAVQFAHITATVDRSPGTRFTANVPVGCWTEPDLSDQDEIILFGFD